MDFREYLRVLRRGWPAIAALTVLGVVAAFIYLALAPRAFVSEAVVLVTTQGSETVAELQQGGQFSQQAVGTYARVAESQAVLDPAIARLNLPLTAQELSGRVTVAVIAGTTLLSISTQDADPELAAEISNAVAASTIDVVEDLNSVSTIGATPLVKVEQIQEARVPTSPVSPDRQVTVALGLFVGIIFGIVAALLAFAFDRSLRSLRDLRLITSRPVIATVPLRNSDPRKPLVVRDDPTSRSAEAFRTLRTNIRFLETSSARSFVITSPAHDEGKSTVAANLAWALAESHRSVILVDANLRHPQVGSLLGLVEGLGLADVLAGHAIADDAIVPAGHEGLSVMLAGNTVPNPSELLGSNGMLDLLRSLEQRFDYVILDSSPILSFTDAALVAACASGTVIAVATGRTRRDQLAAALVTLSNVGVEPLGIVVTRSKGEPSTPPSQPVSAAVEGTPTEAIRIALSSEIS